MMKRADYSATAEQFLAESAESILGSLTANAHFAVEIKQRNAWLATIAHLKDALVDHSEAHIFLEFTIPRMGRRVDAVVLSGGCLFVLEYKMGYEHFYSADIDQVVGYALDLKNFHEPSHRLSIFPILIASGAGLLKSDFLIAKDGVCECILLNESGLSDVIKYASKKFHGDPISACAWIEGKYKPTPTIVEAAQALYQNHRVDDITRNEAGAENLSCTAAYVSAVIDTCKRNSQKAICFITGVPGSGKTLAGLNIANLRTQVAEDEYAVFLSGNGPLVKVLRCALIRDQSEQARAGVVAQLKRQSVEQFIQNIHHFRDANVGSNAPPIEKVVLFDEAQRAWNTRKASQFMRKERNCPDFHSSEPEFLLSVMDRHHDWCTVVCLVGNGQEINTGEAGLNEWLIALRMRFAAWKVHISDRILEEPDTFGVREFPLCIETDKGLHLSTAIRSFRSESVSAFASAIIDGKPEEARALSTRLNQFEFRITRDLATARQWLRSHRRGKERAGLLAFSNGIRLKPEGIFVKAAIEPENWFLADRSDIRSSDYLEDVATEFDVQGLELDWACVCIDANLRITANHGITPATFRGTRWQAVHDGDRRQYILNAHRVLLTRARQGAIVFIPKGNADDPTRKPIWYDDIYRYFTNCGLQEL